nr:hypothetical protein [Tanacetum cinerariifolium]
MLPVELTNEDIRDSAAYKEYYPIASGPTPPKTKASMRKTQSSFDTTMAPPTAVSTRLSTSAKGKQPAKSSKAKGLSVLSEVAMTEAEQMKLATKRSLLGMNVGCEEGHDAEDDDEELYRDVNINLEGTDSLFESTPRVDVQASTIVAPLTLTAPTLFPSTIPTISQVPQAPTPLTTAPSTFLQDLLNFGSLFGFDHRLKTLEANFFEFGQTNQFAGALQDEAQAENEEFLNKLDENIQKIIKDKVKEQVKTSYAVAADLFEMELKKILIEKMESNKSIHRSDKQRNLYKALVKDEEPSAGLDRGSKRIREGKEPESTSTPKEKATKTTGKSTEGSKSHQKTASESAPAEEPMQTTQDLEEPSHQEFETGAQTSTVLRICSQQGGCSRCLLKRRIIVVIELQIIEWHNYKHLDWITVRRDDDKLYKFKEERFSFNVSLRMFTRSIVLQHHVEDLQLGVESYQKKLNLTKPDMYRFDLKHKEAYTTYSNPRGFIYQNKDKQNMLMRIDELHKFSDGRLNDVRTALDDHLKGFRMKYLPQAI